MHMEDNKQFLSLLKPVLGQLWRERMLKEGQFMLVLLGVWSLTLLLLARIFVIPFLVRYFLIGYAFIVIGQVIHLVYKRPRNRDAILLYNAFVPDDRVITAYSFFGHKGLVERLQLQDAVKQMKKCQTSVLKRKKAIFVKKWLLSSLVLCLAVLILAYLPNGKSEIAKKKETDIKLVQKVEKDLEKKIEEEKDPAVKKALQEVEKKLKEKRTSEEALQELAKQTKKLELQALKEKEKQKALEGWQQSLDKAGLNELAKLLDQENLQKIEKKLNEINSKWDQLTEEQKKAVSEYSGQQKQLTEKELAELAQKIEDALNSPQAEIQLAKAKDALQKSGMALQQQMTANGTPPSQLAFSKGNGSNGSGKSSPSNRKGKNDSGNKTSSGSGSGSGGSGSGSGGSSGGNGSGSGAGTGNGGNGMGGGAGLGQGSRDFLTVPEKNDGKENMGTDSGPLGAGTAVEQTEGTGPVLKGTARPYSEVYGQYEQSYRESADRYKLPSELEEIVKKYFTNIDPGGE